MSGIPQTPTSRPGRSFRSRSAHRCAGLARTTPVCRKLSSIGGSMIQRQKRKSSSDIQITETKITSTTWRTYKLSPLFNFVTGNAAFKKYARSLTTWVVLNTNKAQVDMEMKNESANSATFSVFKGFASTEADHEAVQIQIKMRKGKENKVMLTALLCAVNLQVNYCSSELDLITYFPLMLVKGGSFLTGHLISWLQSEFSGLISPLTFSSVDLSWMIAMWSGKLTSADDKAHPVNLEFKVPAECEGLSEIKFSINAKSCKNLWDRIHSTQKDKQNFFINEVDTFIKSLESYFYKIFSIDLSSLQLFRIGTSVAYVGSEGKIKIYSEDSVLHVLGLITEISTEKTQMKTLSAYCLQNFKD